MPSLAGQARASGTKDPHGECGSSLSLPYRARDSPDSPFLTFLLLSVHALAPHCYWSAAGTQGLTSLSELRGGYPSIRMVSPPPHPHPHHFHIFHYKRAKLPDQQVVLEALGGGVKQPDTETQGAWLHPAATPGGCPWGSVRRAGPRQDRSLRNALRGKVLLFLAPAPIIHRMPSAGPQPRCLSAEWLIMEHPDSIGAQILCPFRPQPSLAHASGDVS